MFSKKTAIGPLIGVSVLPFVLGMFVPVGARNFMRYEAHPAAPPSNTVPVLVVCASISDACLTETSSPQEEMP